MAESAASVTDDLQPQGRRSSFPFPKPDYGEASKSLKSSSSIRLPPSLSQQVVESKNMKPALNLVLCGRRGAGKTSAAKAILGQTELHSVSSSSKCVKHQEEVCGRQVSLVELPPLYGKPQKAVMEESLRCISLCDPEGVHAFMLVLPVGPLTDEDKGELKTIQDTFSSGVVGFTMILFTVKSDHTAPAVDDFIRKDRDIQELCQICGGRYYVLNVNNKQQISEMFDSVEKMTKEMFTKVQRSDDENQKRGSLRMVLIGKAGSGKGSTANTILNQKSFKTRICPKPLKKTCEQATGEIDGRPIVMVTTPDLFDKALEDDEVQQEFGKCITLLAPGPHVFLLVLQIGNFTEEEKGSVELIRRVFGEKSRDFTIIVFTRGEELADHNQSFQSYIDACDDFVKQLIKECGGRYQVFNNKDHTNRTQVRELMTKIENMLKENGCSYYNNEMFQLAKEALQREVEHIMKKEQNIIERKYEEMQQQQRKLEAKIAELERSKQQGEESNVKMEEQMKKLIKELEDVKKKHVNKDDCNIL